MTTPTSRSAPSREVREHDRTLHEDRCGVHATYDGLRFGGPGCRSGVGVPVSSPLPARRARARPARIAASDSGSASGSSPSISVRLRALRSRGRFAKSSKPRARWTSAAESHGSESIRSRPNPQHPTFEPVRACDDDRRGGAFMTRALITEWRQRPDAPDARRHLDEGADQQPRPTTTGRSRQVDQALVGRVVEVSCDRCHQGRRE